MEKKRKTKIQKWDEVGGAVETEVETIGDSFDETPGAGPSVSRNPMRGIEDMVEQNDNSFDGIINNLPNYAQPAETEAKSQHARESVIKKLKDCVKILEEEKGKNPRSPVCEMERC